MLVISRRKGESVTIGPDIEIVVTQVTKSGVKLGIRAPRGYTVLRSEVRTQIKNANEEAARSSIEQAGILLSAAEGLAARGTGTLLGLKRQAADAGASQPGDGGKAKPDANASPRRSSRAPASNGDGLPTGEPGEELSR